MKGKAKWSLLLSLVVVLSLFLTACSSGGSKSSSNGGSSSNGNNSTSSSNGGSQLAADQTLSLAAADYIPTMDPTQATDTTSTDAITTVESGLTRMHNDKVTYDMAAGPPKVSADGLTYTYTLRDGITWSDGSPVTAQDFVYGWRHQVDPKTGAKYNWLYSSAAIKNADAIIAGKMSPDKLGISAPDKKHVVITLTRPQPFDNSMFSAAQFMPLKQSFVEKEGKKFAQTQSDMLYNGPFTMSIYDKTKAGNKWQFKKNPNYWNAKNIKLTTVNFYVNNQISQRVNMYKTGQIDEAGLHGDFIDQMKSSNASEFNTGLTSSTDFLYLNEKSKALANKNVRLAIYEAINRPAFAKQIQKDGSIASYFAVPKKFAFGPNGKDFRTYAPNGFYSNATAADATKLWNQAKKTLGISTLKLTFLTPDGDVYKTYDQYIANQIETALPGVKVTINQQVWGAYLKANTAGQYDIAFSGWAPDYRDPMTYLDMWTSTNSQNTMNYKDPKFDNLIKQAKNETDPSKRWADMQQAEKILLKDDVAMVPIDQRGHAWVQKPYVKGLSFPLYGQVVDFTQAYIAKH